VVIIQENIKRRGLIFVISAPSGTGKTTIARSLMSIDNHISFSISVTTRTPRPGEIDGLDYHFVSKDTFKSMVESDQLLEYAEVFGNFYGTPRAQVETALSQGEDLLFDIEWQGHNQLMSSARDDLASIFILPPSKKELLNRLQLRNADSDETIQNRMDHVNFELSHWHKYDYHIINRNLDESVDKLYSILKAERLKKSRRIGLANFVGDLVREEVKESIIKEA
jgi:guanylate kinase